MSAFTVPSLSDDEWEDQARGAARLQVGQKTLFERRKEFSKDEDETTKSNISTRPLTEYKAASTVVSKPETGTSLKDPIRQKQDADEPLAPSAAQAGSTSTSSPYRILVNKKQKGNPILKLIRNVPWEYGAIIPDYELGMCSCALYLSVKYHNRFPQYIHQRLKELGKSYELRVLLIQVDTKQQDISHELNQLSRICILADCTMVLAFSHEEAGRYLEVYKAYENKPPTDIMVKTKTDFLSQATEFLTAIKGVNKTDVTTLLTKFKTIKAIINADIDSLSLCPGIGPVKARRLHTAFTSPFLKPRALSGKSGLSSQPDEIPSDVFDDSDSEVV